MGVCVGDWARSLVLLGNSLKVCGDISDCHRDGPGFYWHLVGGDQRTMVFCTGHPESVPPTVPQVGKHPVCGQLGLEPNSVVHVHSSHCFMVAPNFQEGKHRLSGRKHILTLCLVCSSAGLFTGFEKSCL